MLKLLGVILLVISSLEAQQKCFKTSESWKTCSSRCEPTCARQNPKCWRTCGPPSCQCDQGYFRDPNTGECFDKTACKAISNVPLAKTCATLTCPNMYQCMDGDGRATCFPIPTDPVDPAPSCDNVRCNGQEYCSMGEGIPKCIPLMTDPVPPSPSCDNVKCNGEEYCTMSEGMPKCVPLMTDEVPRTDILCSTQSDCPRGMSCIGVGQKTCAPVHIDPGRPSFSCENLKCRDAEFCVDEATGPTCVKAPVDPMVPSTPRCGGRYCSPSQFCKTDRVSCTRAPCPPNREVCEDLPFVATSPPARELPNSCGPNGMICRPGESCQAAMNSCLSTPCPDPTYTCERTGEQCDNEVCGPNQTCVGIPNSCSRAPCPPPRKVCMDDGPTTTPRNEFPGPMPDPIPGPTVPDSCSSVRCPRGQRCRMQTVRCYRAPCPPVPTCYY